MPAALFPIRVTPKEAYPFLRLFFQKGSLQDSTTNTKKWFYPYSYDGSTCEVWGSIVRELAATGTSTSHRLTGAVCNSITISPTADYIDLTASVISRDIELNRDTSGDTFTLPTDAPLLWRNSVTKMGNSYTAPETCDFRGIKTNLKNNITGKFYNNDKVKRFNIGNFTGNGTVIIPWENGTTNYTDNQVLTDFLNGTLTRLSMYWIDQYLTSGYSFSVNLLCRYIQGNIGEETEISNSMNFVLVEDYSFSSSNSKISTWTIDGSDASLMTFTFPSTETLTGNVFPGDVVATLDASAGHTINWVIERVVDADTVKLINNHTAGTGASGTSVIIKRQPISIGLRDEINRGIT
uniref:Tail protein n=1 Tax=viral metagenome TaxID=1070528 RepID=A0A6M3XK38_9ZZZZ